MQLYIFLRLLLQQAWIEIAAAEPRELEAALGLCTQELNGQYEAAQRPAGRFCLDTLLEPQPLLRRLEGSLPPCALLTEKQIAIEKPGGRMAAEAEQLARRTAPLLEAATAAATMAAAPSL